MNMIREIRKARNMSQQAMVTLSGGVLRHQMRVSQLERGEVEPTVAELVTLTHLLGVSKEVLLGEVELKYPYGELRKPKYPTPPPRPKIQVV